MNAKSSSLQWKGGACAEWGEQIFRICEKRAEGMGIRSIGSLAIYFDIGLRMYCPLIGSGEEWHPQSDCSASPISMTFLLNGF